MNDFSIEEIKKNEAKINKCYKEAKALHPEVIEQAKKVLAFTEEIEQGKLYEQDTLPKGI